MRSLLFVILLLPFPLVAQTAAKKPDAPPTDPKDLCTVDGTVINALTKEKLRKVNLALKSPKHNYEASSDLNGLFLFENVEPGTYRLEGDRQGFAHQWYGGKRPGQFGPQLTLIRAQKMSALEMKMTPNASVSGKLTDEDGDPVGSASVQLLRSNFNNGKMEMSSWGYANADDEGVFKVTNVPPGKYFLRVSPTQRNYSDTIAKAPGAKTEQGYITTYFPGVMDLSGAAPIQVTAGQATAGVNVQLRKTAVYRIKGVISGASLVGQQNVLVQALRVDPIPSRGAMGRSAIRKSDGTFEITGVASGQYMLVLSTYGGQQRTLARQSVNVGSEDVENISIAPVGAPVLLKGSVTVLGDNPPSLAGIRISLTSTEDPYASASTTVKEDGTFFLPDLAPNKYMVSVYSTPDGTYLKAITSGDRDITTATLDLDRSSGEVPLAISVGLTSAKLDGTVQDDKGQPVLGAIIMLTPEPIGSELSRFRTNAANSDKDGKFKLKSIAPGTYRIFAFEDFDGPGDMDPEFLKKLQNKATRIEVKENSKDQIELKQITAAESEQARHQ